MIRLATVQGPIQMLNVLAVMAAQDAHAGGSGTEDHLVIHGLDTVRAEHIDKATLELAGVRRWRSIVQLRHYESAIAAGLASASELRRHIGLAKVDIIYAARNWQSTNEALLSAYEDAIKVLYGDALGLADSFLWPGFVRFDRADLCLPVEGEYGILDQIPLNIVPRCFLQDVIDRFAASRPTVADHVRASSAWLGADGLLVLPTNGTESGWIRDVDTEIDLYTAHVLRHVQPGQRVLVKPHPRESQGQSAAVCRVLQERHGIAARTVPGFVGALPVEVLFGIARLGRVLSLISSSGPQLKYLYGVDCMSADPGLTLPRLQPAIRAYAAAGMSEVDRLMRSVASWDGASVAHRMHAVMPGEREALNAAIEALNGSDFAAAYERFEQLRATGCKLPQIQYGRAAALLGSKRTLRGMLALRSLWGTPYWVPAAMLLEQHEGTRRLRNAVRWVRRLPQRASSVAPASGVMRANQRIEGRSLNSSPRESGPGA